MINFAWFCTLYKRNHIACIFVYGFFLSALYIHVVAGSKYFLPFLTAAFHCMNSSVIFSFCYGYTLELFSVLGCYELHCCEHPCSCLLPHMCLFMLAIYLGIELQSYNVCIHSSLVDTAKRFFRWAVNTPTKGIREVLFAPHPCQHGF